jgi:hypothetical protein
MPKHSISSCYIVPDIEGHFLTLDIEGCTFEYNDIEVPTFASASISKAGKVPDGVPQCAERSLGAET